ncbi:MAG: hypothetical protein CSA65_01975 [Proteobacteria bacterium]|nr:MAG: hypothetical protein CSB49_03375 [Pseudomonadota bacterium]PIE19567.1 MAG: hypothetical protein CSA65_01975 [Pseudomonadota bacterium]
MARERLGDILKKAGLLDEAGLRRALNEQQRWGGPLGQYLVQMELITEETLVRALSTQYKLPAVALDPPRLNVADARQIPQEICERNHVICFRSDDSKNFLDVAMADPSSLDAIDEVRVVTRRNVRPFFAAPSAIDEAIKVVFYGEMDGAMGGVIDLSPASGTRTDSRSLGALDKVAAKTGSAPKLQVKVTPNAPRPAPPPPPPRDGGLRPTNTEEAFHVSMEVPAVEVKASVDSDPKLRRRLERVEAALARNSALLQLLLNPLVQNGQLDHAAVASLLDEH